MDEFAVPDTDRCPRCGQPFHCGRHDPAPCACSTLVLGAERLAELRARYTGCLCLPCLRVLATSDARAGHRRPDQGPDHVDLPASPKVPPATA